jgi:hypothetical protein
MTGFGWESSGGGGGSLPSGFLQVAGGVPLDTTLRTITDGVGNASPLQLSTVQVKINTTDQFIVNTGATIYSHPIYIGAGYYFIIDNNGGTVNTNAIGSGTNYKWDINSSNKMNLDTNGNLILGTTTASARLHVRGDGTNPIARFETSAGTETHIFRDSTQLQFGSQGNYITATANGTTSSTAGRGLLFVGQSGQGIHQFNFSSSNGETSGTIGGINLTGSYGVASGSALYQPLRIAYTINNVGTPVTGTATGIFLNATETALNGMGHDLLDLQVGGSSRFKATSSGVCSAITFVTGNEYQFSVGTRIRSTDASGTILFGNHDLSTFGLLQFGNTTNAFPAIKRNGAAIDFRLADDSGFCNVQASQFISNLFVGTTAGRMDIRGQYDISIAGGFTGGVGGVAISQGSNATPNASALLDISSTTKGFLPPRMTTTQVNAIASPAEGLVVYSTTENALCLYTGSSWRKLNDSPL